MTLAEQIELACLMEATARKPGNVHPLAAFADLRYADFVEAGRAIARPLSEVHEVGLGRAIYHAVKGTKVATGTNVNLGIILLLAPLAAVPAGLPLRQGIASVLDATTIDDADQVYAAIRLAQPGGMGKADSQDIHDRPTVTLRDAMALAAERDRIAEQYVTNYQIVFAAREQLAKLVSQSLDWEAQIIWLHLWILSQWPDTLIARKCGIKTAQECSRLAGELLSKSNTTVSLDPSGLAEFDRWLRSDGHRRNPGTTADLIAATLFAAMRDGLITAPSRQDVAQAAKTMTDVFSERRS